VKKYDKALMDTAHVWSAQSYCKRKKVGAVLSKEGRILAIGYNGTLSGTPNECEELIKKCNKCGSTIDIENHDICHKDSDYITENITSNKTLHAEENLIAFCSKHGIPTNNTTIFITLSPCIRCARLIAQAGIKRVVYDNEYKDTSGIELLKEVGITVEKYN